MRPFILGVAGGTGSGKTTVARRLLDGLPRGSAVLIEHDWYYLDRSGLAPLQRAAINFDEPNALDNERLRRDLDSLRSGIAVECPQYDFTTHTRLTATRHLQPSSIIIVEGILIFAVPELREAFDLRLFVDTDDDIRLLRRIRRDIEDRGRDIGSIESQYRQSVRPMHLLHVAPSRTQAHLIIPEGGENAPAVDVIVGRLLHLLDA